MYLEVYADSYLLLQFVMNWYLLGLVNSMLRQSISQKRMLCGAFFSALVSLLPFLLPLPILGCMICSLLLSVMSLCMFTFQTYQKEAFWNVLEKLSISTLLLGAMVLLIIRILPKGMDTCLGTAGVLFLGGCVYLILIKVIKRNRVKRNVCKVVLFGEEKITVEALLDTGNSLVEPISGKPVAVLDKAVFEQLYNEGKFPGFRAIPYHSIGKQNGILPGYLLNRILVETEESTKEYKEIYVGVSEDIISESSTYKMILNPKLLE